MARRVWIQIHHQESQLSSANDKVFGIICSLTGLPQKFRSLLAAVIFDPPGGPESFKPGVQLAHSQSIYHSVRAGARRNRRAAVPRSRGSPISTPFHGADGADALQGIGQQWPSGRGNDDRRKPGGLRSLAAAVRRYQLHFTAPTERAPSRESASNAPSVSVQA